MFSMHDFIMEGLLDAVGKMADYQVILNAAGWNQKGVLTEDDLAVIQKAIDDKNTPPTHEELIPNEPSEIDKEIEKDATIKFN